LTLPPLAYLDMLQDPSQVLFKACPGVNEVPCAKPVMVNLSEEPCCPLHLQVPPLMYRPEGGFSVAQQLDSGAASDMYLSVAELQPTAILPVEFSDVSEREKEREGPPAATGSGEGPPAATGSGEGPPAATGLRGGTAHAHRLRGVTGHRLRGGTAHAHWLRGVTGHRLRGGSTRGHGLRGVSALGHRLRGGRGDGACGVGALNRDPRLWGVPARGVGALNRDPWLWGVPARGHRP